MVKNMLIILALIAPSAVHAQLVSPQPPAQAAPSNADLQQISAAKAFLDQEGVHIFDNVGAGACYDALNHEWFKCVSSQFFDVGYKKVVYATVGAGFIQGSKLPFLTLNPQVVEAITSLPVFNSIKSALGLDYGWADCLTAKSWFTRDFYAGKWRGGFYTGIKVDF